MIAAMNYLGDNEPYPCEVLIEQDEQFRIFIWYRDEFEEFIEAQFIETPLAIASSHPVVGNRPRGRLATGRIGRGAG